MKNITILTGAGISAESGLSTFRDEDGLWCKHRIEDVATPEGFERDPDLVYDFYNARRAQLKDVQPNPAHHALATLAAQHTGNLLLVTQNVDDLHQRALSQITPRDSCELIAMHGELYKARCLQTGAIHTHKAAITSDTPCPCCKIEGNLRPHIVWFGEMPLAMDRIYAHLQQCDLFIAIGTSGNVYPAAGFAQEARQHGAHTVEMNVAATKGHSQFDETIYGPASQTVPAFIDRLLNT